MYRAVMGSLFHERAHMGKILTSSNISYRTIHGHLSTSAKLAMPFFSGIFLPLHLFMFLSNSEFVSYWICLWLSVMVGVAIDP